MVSKKKSILILIIIIKQQQQQPNGTIQTIYKIKNKYFIFNRVLILILIHSHHSLQLFKKLNRSNYYLYRSSYPRRAILPTRRYNNRSPLLLVRYGTVVLVGYLNYNTGAGGIIFISIINIVSYRNSRNTVRCI